MIKSIVLVSGDSKVIQFYVYMYLFFFKLFPHLVSCIILSSVPCAI